jgi:mono/diheme cytochrome c family protein
MLRRQVRTGRQSELAQRGGWIDLFGAEEGVAEEEEEAEYAGLNMELRYCRGCHARHSETLTGVGSGGPGFK